MCTENEPVSWISKENQSEKIIWSCSMVIWLCGRHKSSRGKNILKKWRAANRNGIEDD